MYFKYHIGIVVFHDSGALYRTMQSPIVALHSRAPAHICQRYPD